MTARPLDVVRTDEDFPARGVHRVQQGDVAVGRHPMVTLLRSCVCIGCHHTGEGLGALSHVTGFSADGAHAPTGALAAIAGGLRRHGVEPADCTWFVVGGADGHRHVYEGACAALTAQGLSFDSHDTMGRAHRKVMLDPATGRLLIYRRDGDPLPPDDSLGRFHDPKRRVITGASTLFRNERLLDLLQSTVMPAVATGPRLSFWCAGCSTGMEVYSVTMVALDWLARRDDGTPVQFGVVGSDISDDALAVARRGVYQVSQRVKQGYGSLLTRYTDPISVGAVAMAPSVRAVTRFVRRDIAEGSRRMRFDLVICDHVLQYFTPSRQIDLLGSLVAALLPGAFLYASSPHRDVRTVLVERWGLVETAHHLYRVTPAAA